MLPFTYVGAGLDVMHSVVGFRRLTHLVRNVEVEISDGKLVGMAALRAVSRLAGSTAGFFAFLPKQIYRETLCAVRSPKCRGQSRSQGSRQKAPLKSSVVGSQASVPNASEFPPLAVARRYGDQ